MLFIWTLLDALSSNLFGHSSPFVNFGVPEFILLLCSSFQIYIRDVSWWFISQSSKQGKKIRLTNLKLANKYQVTFDNHLKDSVKNSLNKGIWNQ